MPTVLPTAIPAVPASVAPPVVASALPGTVRKPVLVSTDVLMARFPSAEPDQLDKVKAVLAGSTPETWDTPAWLNFGVEAQESVTEVVKARLAILDGDVLRGVPQHLGRLQSVLADVLDSLRGGLLKRSARQTWLKLESEVTHLEQLLSDGCETLFGVLNELVSLATRSLESQAAVTTHFLAAEYLAEGLAPEKESLLLARRMALATSQALLQEHMLALRQDAARVQELITLVQDGVLLKLPAAYSQLASLPERPSDTQRYLAVDKLNDLMQFFERKQTWLSK